VSGPSTLTGTPPRSETLPVTCKVGRPPPTYGRMRAGWVLMSLQGITSNRSMGATS